MMKTVDSSNSVTPEFTLNKLLKNKELLVSAFLVSGSVLDTVG